MFVIKTSNASFLLWLYNMGIDIPEGKRLSNFNFCARQQCAQIILSTFCYLLVSLKTVVDTVINTSDAIKFLDVSSSKDT